MLEFLGPRGLRRDLRFGDLVFKDLGAGCWGSGDSGFGLQIWGILVLAFGFSVLGFCLGFAD